MKFKGNKCIKLCFLFMVIKGPNCLYAQVVNIEQARLMADSVGWTGKIHAGFQSQHFSEYLINGNLRFSAQIKNSQRFFLILGEVGYTASKQTDFTNYKMLHVRFSEKVYNNIRWEGFLQLQQNRPLGIDYRFLAGTGPRIRLWSRKYSRMYFGTVVMAEKERPSSLEDPTWQARSSSYLNIFTSKDARISFSGSVYYQPLFTSIGDFRISGQYTINFAINRHVGFFTEITHIFDSRPPSNAPSKNLNTQFGLTYEFE